MTNSVNGNLGHVGNYVSIINDIMRYSVLVKECSMFVCGVWEDEDSVTNVVSDTELMLYLLHPRDICPCNAHPLENSRSHDVIQSIQLWWLSLADKPTNCHVDNP